MRRSFIKIKIYAVRSEEDAFLWEPLTAASKTKTWCWRWPLRTCPHNHKTLPKEILTLRISLSLSHGMHTLYLTPRNPYATAATNFHLYTLYSIALFFTFLHSLICFEFSPQGKSFFSNISRCFLMSHSSVTNSIFTAN